MKCKLVSIMLEKIVPRGNHNMALINNNNNWYFYDDKVVIEIKQYNKLSEFFSDQDIIKSKVGNIDKYLAAVNENEASDDDPNIAYQKQLFDTRAKLKQFCATRNSTTKTNVDNYELLANVEENADKINQLKSIVQNIIKYEPDKTNIINQYPIISQN